MELIRIFTELDKWIIAENSSAVDGHHLIKKCYFKLLGQTALFLSKLNIDLYMTADVDAYSNAEYSVLNKLDELLKNQNLKFDHLSSEIWMPEETEYVILYEGQYLSASYAKAEYLLIAKAKFAREKNKNLLINYLANNPSTLFFKLAKKYNINLEF